MTNEYFTSASDFRKYVLNERNWVVAGTKLAEYWCCFPPVGTEFYDELRGRKGMTTTTHPFLMQGSCGEFYTLSSRGLVTTYNLPTSEELTIAWLESKVQGGVINWFKVRSRLKEKHRVLLVPAWYTAEYFEDELKMIKGYEMCNSPKVSQHGFGDYIISPLRATLNLADCYLMNGAVFANTYESLRLQEGTMGIEDFAGLQSRPESLFV